MVYSYTSCKKVIAKVITDLDLQEGDYKVSDFVEWVGEGLEEIGAFPSLITKVTGRENTPCLEINNYQAVLPGDFHTVIHVGYATSADGPFYPMRYSTGVYDKNPSEVITSSTTDDTITSIVVADTDLVSLVMRLYDLTYPQALAKLAAEPDLKSILSSLIYTNSPLSGVNTYTTDYTYVIVGDYIKTNQATGYLMVAYQAIPTDVEGYPLIPNNVDFINALSWYVAMKYYYPKWTRGQIREEVYKDARRAWSYFSKKAFGVATMPDRGQLESFKNSWLRLIPNINEIDTDFQNMGEQQVVYTQNE